MNISTSRLIPCLAVMLLSSCGSREGERDRAVNTFHETIVREMCSRVKADWPGGGKILLVLPPDTPAEKESNRSRVAGARSALAKSQISLIEHRIGPADYAFDTLQGTWAVKDFTTGRLASWAAPHGNLQAIVSLVGLPAEPVGDTTSLAPLYWMNFGPAAPEVIGRVRSGRIRGLLTPRGANPPARGVSVQPATVLSPDQYEWLVPSSPAGRN